MSIDICMGMKNDNLNKNFKWLKRKIVLLYLLFPTTLTMASKLVNKPRIS